MLFKSRIYTSACISVCGGGSVTALSYLVQKYIVHGDVPFWLVAACLFLSILSCYILVYVLFPLLKKVAEWEKKHERHGVANTILQSCFGGIVMATLYLLVDVALQVKREIGFILIRYTGMVMLCVLAYWYRKLRLFLSDKMAKKASFILWMQCAIIFGLLYIGIGFGLFLAFVMVSIMPFINIDVFWQLVFDIAGTMILVGFFSGNAVYIIRVLKWKKIHI
ncbi:MAG: hypothetical protein LBL31_03350 [Spirochaetaceae bacterium]|jgi:hypothetical protein|nr:hypothetical protein [Spirochaetaceae bacterium]